MGKRQRRRCWVDWGATGFHGSEGSSLGVRSNGESLPVSYCLLLGQCFAGKQGNGLLSLFTFCRKRNGARMHYAVNSCTWRIPSAMVLLKSVCSFTLSWYYCQMLVLVHEAALRHLPNSFWKDMTVFISPQSICCMGNLSFSYCVASGFFWKKLKPFKAF